MWFTENNIKKEQEFNNNECIRVHIVDIRESKGSAKTLLSDLLVS